MAFGARHQNGGALPNPTAQAKSNAGIFIWSIPSILKAFEAYQPAMLAHFMQGYSSYNTASENDFIKEYYPLAENISIDYAIMEKAKNTFVLSATFDWNDLAQEWRNHRFSYTEKSENSEKHKHAVWAKKQTEVIEQLLDPSKKFISQLNKLFSQETADLNHISERIQAAFGYFLEPMDDLVFEILWKLEEVKRIKKVKAFYDELIVLEELQSKAVLRLMKAKLLIETVVAGDTISKEKLTSSEIKNYISRKTEAIQNQFKKLNITLIDDDKDIEQDQVDLAIPLGSGEFSKHRRWPFVEEEIFAVCSPSYLAAQGPITKPADLVHHTLLHLEERYRSRMDWATWLSRLGVSLPKGNKQFRFNDYSIILQAALEGQGIALGWGHLIKPALKQGQLVQVIADKVQTQHPFQIIAGRNRPLRPDVIALKDWLIAETSTP